MIETALAIALVANWLVTDLAYYAHLKRWTRIDFDRKPMNCPLCLSFWMGFGVFMGQYHHMADDIYWGLPFVASALAVLIEEIKSKLWE